MLTTSFLASTAPRLIAPAMNDRMWDDEATRANVATLRERGVEVLEPGEGALASRGERGAGRLQEPRGDPRRDRGRLGGAAVAAGPWDGPARPGHRRRHPRGDRPGALHRQPLQRPDGRRARRSRGPPRRRRSRWSPPTSRSPTPPGVERIDVDERRRARRGDGRGLRRPADVLVMAAAVADFRPRERRRGQARPRGLRRDDARARGDRGRARRARRPPPPRPAAGRLRRRARGRLRRAGPRQARAQGPRRDRRQRRLRRVDRLRLGRQRGDDRRGRRRRHAVPRGIQGRASPRRSSTGSTRCASQPRRQTDSPSRLGLARLPTLDAWPTSHAEDDTYELYTRGMELLESGDFAAAAVPLRKVAAPRAREVLRPRGARPRAVPLAPLPARPPTEFEAVVERYPVNDFAHFCLGRALALSGRRRSGPPPPGDRGQPAARPRRLPRLPPAPARRPRRAAACARSSSGSLRLGPRRRRREIAADRAGDARPASASAAATAPAEADRLAAKLAQAADLRGRRRADERAARRARDPLRQPVHAVWPTSSRGNRPGFGGGRRPGAGRAALRAGVRARSAPNAACSAPGWRSSSVNDGPLTLLVEVEPRPRNRLLIAAIERVAILAAHLFPQPIRRERWAAGPPFFRPRPGRAEPTDRAETRPCRSSQRDIEVADRRARSRASSWSLSSRPVAETLRIYIDHPGGRRPRPLRAGHQAARATSSTTGRSRSPRPASTGR